MRVLFAMLFCEGCLADTDTVELGISLRFLEPKQDTRMPFGGGLTGDN